MSALPASPPIPQSPATTATAATAAASTATVGVTANSGTATPATAPAAGYQVSIKSKNGTTGQPGQPVELHVATTGVTPDAPTSGVTINWGDGSLPYQVGLWHGGAGATAWAGDASHTYNAAGTYTITVTGPLGPSTPPTLTYTAKAPTTTASASDAPAGTPFANAQHVTPSDDKDLPAVTRAIHVSQGTVRVTMATGGNVVLFPPGSTGNTVLAIRVSRVWATGTTASVIALW